MAATFKFRRRQGGGDPSLQAAAALTLAATDIARLVEDGLMRSSTGRPAIKAEVVGAGEGASLVLTARHRELAAAIQQAKIPIARILRTAWQAAGSGRHFSGGLPDGH